MRNFIVSDLHGNGAAYDSIINYVSNEKEYGNDDVTLHINGDLIDKGVDSGSMLVDVIERIKSKDGINIDYLAGNHELLMYRGYIQTKTYYDEYFLSTYFSDACMFWSYYNNGYITERYLKKHYNREEISKMCEFLGELTPYHVFEETIDGKKILLVHACACKMMENNEPLILKDDKTALDAACCARREEFAAYGFPPIIGNDNFFTIVGHTQSQDPRGYDYTKLDNVLNIDGCCGSFGMYNIEYLGKIKSNDQGVEDVKISFDEYDGKINEIFKLLSHVPLVEIEDNRLKILTFNHKNEIINGEYFEDYEFHPIDNNELNKCRVNLQENGKVRKRERKY